MKKYKLAITFSGFGTEEEVLKMFAGKNRELIIDNSENVGIEDEEHHTGIIYETIETDNFKSFMTNYIQENSYQGECFGIYEIGGKKEIFTEEHLN